jgi:two-component system OmpR family response regulator
MARVLILEDTPEVLEMISVDVAALGVEVDPAADGQVGLDKARAGDYDLIVLDLMMPHVDGIQFLEALRGMGKQTPVLVVTAVMQRPLVVSLMRLGIADYIVKPFKLDELQGKIRKVLGLAGPSVPSAPEPPAADAEQGEPD